MALTPLKVPQLLATRFFSISSIVSKPPVARSCNCPEESSKKKKGVQGDPNAKKCGTCPCPGKPSKLWKLCMFGAKTGIAGGLVYWTYHQGLWSNSERSEVLMERLKSVSNVLVYGSTPWDSAMAADCCEYGKDENEILQRLKTAYCFLKLDSTAQPTIVEDAVYIGTLGDDDDFCRCDICKPVAYCREETSSGGPEPKPSEKAGGSSSGQSACEEPAEVPEPTRGEWIWNKWSSQNWSPKTCIFSKQCACGDKTEGAASAPEAEEDSTPAEDKNYYVDEYFIIRKEGEEDKEGEKGEKSGGDKGGEEAAASEGGGEEGAGEESAGEEEAAEEEPAAEEAE